MPDKPKILIVDDRKENLVALRATLSELNANVIEATNGNDALAATLNHQFALAILDVQMPGMDGYELADYMQNDSTTYKIPVIFLTANYLGEDKISKGYETGAVDYLVKPYDPFILLAKVSVFLALNNQRIEIKKYSDHLEELVSERTKNLDKAIEDLKLSNKELEQFTKIAAHDLQEPLRRVSSYSQLLERKYKQKIDSEADEIIEYIVEGAKHLQEMILDLHDYIEINSNESEISKVDLKQTVKKSLKQLDRQIRDTKAIIVFDDLPCIRGNAKYMTRLFFNLLDNAIKFKGEGEPPVIKIASKEFDDCWQISIKDNGIGIEQVYYDQVFHIFRMLHPKSKYGGRGIGLSVAKRIIERHNGKIWIESEPRTGTTIFFTIKKNL